MLRPALAPLALTAVAVGASGCGESEKEAYTKRYKPVDDKLVALVRQVAGSVRRARGKPDRQIAREFGAYSKRMGGLQQDVDSLNAPQEVGPEQDKLVEAMGDSQGALEGIEKAANDSNPSAARRATLELVTSAAELRQARRDIARELNVKIE